MHRSIIVVLLALVAPAVQALLIGGAASPMHAARCASAKAQMAPAPLKTKQTTKTTGPGGGGGQGGGAPTVSIAKPKRKAHTEDVPLFKVILLGDEEYEEDPVLNVLKQCIPEIGNLREAQVKYKEAQSTGKSVLLVVNKELGEAYVEKLARHDPEMIVFADIEEE